MKNRKWMVGAIGLILCFFVMFDLTQYDAFAKNEKLNIIAIKNEMNELYKEDSEFYREAKSKGMTYEELLHQKSMQVYNSRRKDLKNNTNISTFSIGNNGRYVYADVPLIQQTKTYNCGPTSVLQAIYGTGDQNSVKGSSDARKIETLSAQCSTNSTDGTYVYKLKNCLNKYNFYSTYGYFKGDTIGGVDKLQTKIENSLFYNMAPILHAQTRELEYYDKHESGHYIVIKSVNKNNNKLTVQDCNISDKYFGTHEISMEEAYRCINPPEGSRYLICKD